jgi:hypothetical protein
VTSTPSGEHAAKGLEMLISDSVDGGKNPRGRKFKNKQGEAAYRQNQDPKVGVDPLTGYYN